MSPYAYAINSPINNSDPTGAEVIPWFRTKSIFGFSWVSYDGFFNTNEYGKQFTYSFIGLFSSNKVFAKIYDQLEQSKLVFKFQQQNDDGAEGQFRSTNLKGTKESPFTLGFDYRYLENKSAIFEEVFHAGQRLFYGPDEFKKVNTLQIEVEAKVAKAITGVWSDSQEEQRFYNNPSVRKYRELYLKGKKIDNATVSGFYDAVNILAQGVFSHYRDDPDEVVTVDFLNSYNSYISLDFFINILAPKEGGYGTTVVAPKKK